MILATLISGAGFGPIAVWIALGLAIGFALHSARTRHDHSHRASTRSGRNAA
jgi:hypothetical protein